MERFGLAGLLVLFLPSLAPAAAQRITITPTVGAYVPLTNQGLGLLPDIDCDPQQPCGISSITHTLDPAAAAGVKLAVQWPGIFGFELTVGTASPQRQRETVGWMYPVTTPENPGHSAYAVGATRTTTTALRATLSPRLGGRFDVAAGGGISRIYLSGDGYQYEGPNDQSIFGLTFAGTLGFAVAANLRLELAMAYYDYTVTMPYQESTRQHDLVLSTGLGFVLVR